MRRTLPLLGLILLLPSCAAEPSAEEQQRIDDAKVAAVEAANAMPPPLEELRPEIITEEDIAEARIEGAHCTYMPGVNSSPRLIVRPLDAYMKLDGDMVRLAADSGSLELAGGTRTTYNGRAMVVKLAMDGDQGSITIDDAYGREVYAVTGTVACVDGGEAPANPAQADL
ncbi:hypothetical protein [Alteraurantiacibacter buctensis]|uniref:Uncharacterized protein n=1 Tax=Alteraurantiacibacter buctensis TaxID=1503981 RepID=A0A844YX38_9SPHN|nr:hypothetical protein [Alteraurantiacibacter buctensis]MXO72139.1 hypothetical protein [Alteraurantiacibacter buctensis]